MVTIGGIHPLGLLRNPSLATFRFSFSLIDQSYRNASFLGVVSHHLAFLVKAVFHHPVDVLAVEQFSFRHGSLQTAADGVDIQYD